MITKIMELKELKHYMTKEATILKMEHEYDKMLNKINNIYAKIYTIHIILCIVLNIVFTIFNVLSVHKFYDTSIPILSAVLLFEFSLILGIKSDASFIMKIKYKCVKNIYDKNMENYNMLHNTSDIDANYILLSFSRYAGLIK